MLVVDTESGHLFSYVEVSGEDGSSNECLIKHFLGNKWKIPTAPR